MKLDNNQKKYISIITFGFIVYYLIYFILGLIYGFNINSRFNILVILPCVLIIFLEEYIRYKFSDKFVIIISIVVSLVNSFIVIGFYNLNSIYQVFDYVFNGIVVIISLNLLLGALIKKIGPIVSGIIVILWFIAYYLMYLIPNIDKSIISVITILLFLVLYIIIFKYSNEKIFYGLIRKSINLIYVSFALLFILIVGGVFKYKLIAIASTSMTDTINKGDAIIYLKTDIDYEYNLNDIIVFNRDDRQIVHRIVKINDDSFVTKGDNNSDEDMNEVKVSDIKGVYVFRIPMLGIPATWLSEHL